MILVLSRILAVTVLSLIPVLAWATPKAYISWHAPHGSPRASDSLWVTSGDSTRTDTLYVTFDPGNDSPTIYGFEAILTVRPAVSDTLGPYWRNDEWDYFRVEYPSEEPGLARPWKGGYGFPFYYHESRQARFRIMYALAADRAPAIKGGQVYSFARVIFRHPPKRLAMHNQPVCIEVSDTEGGVAFTLGDPMEPPADGVRYLSWNSRGGQLCASLKNKPPVWTPPAQEQPEKPKTADKK